MATYRVRVFRRLAATCVLATSVACIPNSLDSISFPPAYVAQSGQYNAVPGCARYRTSVVADFRSDKRIVGSRYVEGVPNERWPISLTGDVMSWLGTAAQRMFGTTMLTSAPNSWAEIRLNLVGIQVEEKTLRNSNYDATVVIDAWVLRSGTNQVAWQMRSTGHGSTYGACGDANAYQEVLNRAVDEALGKIFTEPQFAATLCRGP
jgi:hypothetical protein